MEPDISHIHKGAKHCFDFEVTTDSVECFARLSGDLNPLHCDADFAIAQGYRGPVMHGAMQQALVSQAVGMWLIGKRCLISRLSTKFIEPLTYPRSIEVKSSLIDWSSDRERGTAEVRVVGKGDGLCYSVSNVEVALTGNSSAAYEVRELNLKKQNKYTKKCIIVTGATGGVLFPIVKQLSNEYHILAIGNNKNRLDELKGLGIDVIELDLVDTPKEQLFSDLDAYIEENDVWGIVHGASVSPVKGKLTDWDKSSFVRVNDLQSYALLSLSSWLVRRCGESGGRVIAIGSDLATHNSPDKNLLCYGVSKSILSSVVKALSLELASKKITVNVVSPYYIPAGMNATVPTRYLDLLKAANSMKRLCSISDVFSQIYYLLSEESSFLSGQEIILNGGNS